MTRLADTVEGVIGVDTHRDTLAAAATDRVGGTLAQTSAAADLTGYQRLLDFAQVQVPGRRCWAVEGAGSYGAGLTAFLQARGEWVVEIGRPKRPTRRSGAKSDALDAIRAAREALACDHPVAPRRRGDREALRVLLATRHSACRAKVSAINQLKALIVGAPEELRAELRGLATKRQITRCASLRDRPSRSLTLLSIDPSKRPSCCGRRPPRSSLFCSCHRFTSIGLAPNPASSRRTVAARAAVSQLISRAGCSG
jgi:transposase